MGGESSFCIGPGLLESAYLECTACEIHKSGLFFEKQKPLPLIYEEVKMDCGYRLDLFVEKKVVVELKSVEALNMFTLHKPLLIGKYQTAKWDC